MKKIVDENGRLFGRVSIIDVVVIAVVAVLAVALYAKDTAVPIAGISDPLQPVEYTVSITNMPAGRLEGLREGDALYNKETGNYVGEIRNIQVEDCVTSILKTDGTYVMARVEDRYNVTLTVDARVMVDERGHYYVERSELVAVGWSMNFNTKASTFAGVITEME